MKSTKKFTVLIPSFDDVIITDEPLSRIQCPSDSGALKAVYDGKKKAFTFNIAIFVSTDGRKGIVGINNTSLDAAYCLRHD